MSRVSVTSSISSTCPRSPTAQASRSRWPKTNLATRNSSWATLNISKEKPLAERLADGLALGQEGLSDAVPEVPRRGEGGGGVDAREGGRDGEEKGNSRHRLALQLQILPSQRLAQEWAEKREMSKYSGKLTPSESDFLYACCFQLHWEHYGWY